MLITSHEKETVFENIVIYYYVIFIVIFTFIFFSFEIFAVLINKT